MCLTLHIIASHPAHPARPKQPGDCMTTQNSPAEVAQHGGIHSFAPPSSPTAMFLAAVHPILQRANCTWTTVAAMQVGSSQVVVNQRYRWSRLIHLVVVGPHHDNMMAGMDPRHI